MNVLIQCGDHFENQTRILILVDSLIAAGFSPFVLMYDPVKGSFLKSFGVKIIYFNNYIGKKYKGESILGRAEELLKAEGRRNIRLLWPSQYKRNLIKSQQYLDATNIILDRYSIDFVFIWNGFTGFVANSLRILCLNRNIKCAFMERGYFKDSLFVDSSGVNGASSLNQGGPEFWKNKKFSNDLLSYTRKIFFPKRADSIVDDEKKYPNLLGKKIIFFPLQVQLDTNIIYYSKYKSMREAFQVLFEKYNSKNAFFVVRPHPEELPDVVHNFPVVNNLLISKKESLDYWIQKSDVVATINSTVGLESLIKFKKTLCIGESIYSKISCINNIKEVIEKEVDKNEVFQYLCYLMSNNVLKKDSNYNFEVLLNIFNRSGVELDGFKKNENFSSCEEKIKNIKNKLLPLSSVNVILDFDFSKKVDIDYRNNKVSINRVYLESLIRKFYSSGEIKFHRKNEFKGVKADILIVDDRSMINFFKRKSCDIIIDVYGAVKYFN